MSTDQQPDSLADGKGWDGSRGARKTNPNDPAEPVPPTGTAWTHDEDDECPRCSKGKLKKITNEGYKIIMQCEKCGYDTVAIKTELVHGIKESKATRREVRCPQCHDPGNFEWDLYHAENTGLWRLFDLDKGEPHIHSQTEVGLEKERSKLLVKCPQCDALNIFTDNVWMDLEELYDHIKTSTDIAHMRLYVQGYRLDLDSEDGGSNAVLKTCIQGKNIEMPLQCILAEKTTKNH